MTAGYGANSPKSHWQLGANDARAGNRSRHAYSEVPNTPEDISYNNGYWWVLRRLGQEAKEKANERTNHNQ